MKKLFIIAYILMFSINSSVGQEYAPIKPSFDPYLIVDELRQREGILYTFISAHRGLHYNEPSFPENSLAAIKNAHDKGFESVELDIKLTKDNVPILSHDNNLARMTYNEYNPFNAGNDDPNPLLFPDVSSLNFAAVKDLRLRKINFKTTGEPIYSVPNPDKPNVKWVGSKDGETVSSLRETLTYIKNNDIRLVILLDIKSVDAALACWSVVNSMKDCKGEPFHKTVIFKMSMKALDNYNVISGLERLGLIKYDAPSDIFDGGDRENLKFAPVFNGADYDKISAANKINKRNWGPIGLAIRIQQYVPGYVYTEINPKNTDITSSGNEWFPFLESILDFNISHYGVFSPTREVPRYGDSPNYGYYNVAGACCYQLGDVYYRSAFYKAKEISDDRADITSYTMEQFNFWITDDAIGARNYLIKEGKRGVIEALNFMSENKCKNSARLSAEETPSPTDDETKLLLYPNPSIDSFTLQYWADEATEATVKILNSTGQVAVQQTLNFEQGINQPTFNTTSFVSGTYFVNVETNGKMLTRKLVVVK